MEQAVNCSVTYDGKEKRQQMSKIGLSRLLNNGPKDGNVLIPKHVMAPYMVKGVL